MVPMPARHEPVPPSDTVDGPSTTDGGNPPDGPTARGRRLILPLPAALFPPERRVGPTEGRPIEKEYGP